MLNFSTSKALSTLVNPDKILPVAMIEVATTGGRVYQGYKRGGETEGKERLREETSTAIFWLFGVKVLNSIGDFIGKKLGVKNLDIDLGRDELRAPYLNIPQGERLKTCAYKFSKVVASAAIATALTGFILPKINHKITNAQRAAKGLEPLPERNGKKSAQSNTKNTNTPLQASAVPQFISMDSFVQQAKQNSANLSFKGAGAVGGGAVNLMASLAHNIENKTAWRLMSTDAGMIAGRVMNSRNKAEGLEFLFRDTASIYFYLFAAPHVAALLNKITGNIFVQPDSMDVVREHIINSMEDKKYSPDSFKDAAKSRGKDFDVRISKIPFNDKGIISLDEFNKATKGKYAKKALRMSQMQPKYNGESLLTRQQAENILSKGWCSEPEFLKRTINAGTYGKALDEKKFVPRKTIENIVSSVDKFCDSMVNYAKKNNVKEIDADFVNKFVKRTMNRNLAFRVAGMFVAGFGLAYLIPKLQYKITEIRTGSKEFPVTAGDSGSSKSEN